MFEANNMTEFKAGVQALTEEQIESIEDELGISATQLSEFDDN